MSIGSNKSSGKTSSTASGLSETFGTAVQADQLPYLQSLWSQASSLGQNQTSPSIGYNAYNQANAANQQGMNALGGANMQGAFNTLNRLQNPGMDPMMNVYARQIGQNFNEQIMPGLRGEAALAGGLGSSRAGIAQGLAGARAGQQLQDFGAQLYGQNQDRAALAAQAAGGLGMQQAGGYMTGGQNAQAIGQFGMGVPWYNMQQFGGLLGSPVMQNLGGYSNQINTSSGKTSSGGFSFGI
jgi:hypothetical protein